MVRVIRFKRGVGWDGFCGLIEFCSPLAPDILLDLPYMAVYIVLIVKINYHFISVTEMNFIGEKVTKIFF